MPDIFDTTYEQFEAQVIQPSFSRPILLDLWADWCSPCIVIAPILSDIIKDRDGTVLLAKCEVDEGENMKLAGRYQVRGFPTIILIQNGKEKARFSGAQSFSYIDQFIDAHME